MTETPINTTKLLEQLKRILNSEPWTVREKLAAYISLIEKTLPATQPLVVEQPYATGEQKL